MVIRLFYFTTSLKFLSIQGKTKENLYAVRVDYHDQKRGGDDDELKGKNV